MPGQGIRLGPFKGGLNNASDPTSIADTELAECINFEFDVDGGLISRPPIFQIPATGVTGGQSSDMLGYFVDAATGNRYLIASSDNETAYFNPNLNTWVTITSGFRASSFVQYLNKAWIVAEPGSASNGGSWTPPALFGDPGVFATVAAMPKGMACGVYKERMFIVAGSKATTNDSRLTFSNLANPGLWTGSDFIDVNPGDGQKLLDLFVVGSSMYLFKADSTYVYSYDASPTKGVINNISKVVGVSGTHCVAQYENVLYVYHEDWVFELINFNYSKLNIKVQFQPNYSLAVTYFRSNSISILGDRLVVRYFDKVYVFNLKTRTWSTWESARNFSHFIESPRASNSLEFPTFYAGSVVAATSTVYRLQDGLDSTTTETMTCRVTTKVYDFDTPEKFKRLYWWGVDVLSSGIVTGTLVPVIYTFNVTWGSLASKTWGSLAAFTWGQPGNLVPTVVDSQDTAGSVGRKFLKFLKAIRFRNLYFVVELTTTGTTATAPVKLFTINPVLNLKQSVSKDVN